MKARYLIDKSALVRMPLEPVKKRLAPIIEAGEAATCAIVDLEVLYSARNHEEHARIRQRRALAYDSVPIDPSTFERAIEVQGELAKTVRHRVPIPDHCCRSRDHRARHPPLRQGLRGHRRGHRTACGVGGATG